MLDELFDRSPQGRDPATDHAALGMLVAAAHIRCRQVLNDGLREVGIEARHFGVLLALGRHGAVSQRRLIELLDVDKSTMVRIIDDFERLGLAERQRAAHDRRAYAIQLTDEGRRRLAAAQRITAEVGDRLFGWLGPRERDQFVDVLRGLVQRASH